MNVDQRCRQKLGLRVVYSIIPSCGWITWIEDHGFPCVLLQICDWHWMLELALLVPFIKCICCFKYERCQPLSTNCKGKKDHSRYMQKWISCPFFFSRKFDYTYKPEKTHISDFWQKNAKDVTVVTVVTVTSPIWSNRIEVGDLPGAPDDQPLYSADGSANWLDPSAVRGTCFGCEMTTPQVCFT